MEKKTRGRVLRSGGNLRQKLSKVYVKLANMFTVGYFARHGAMIEKPQWGTEWQSLCL